jgi:DNA repair exonuclease SbcCD ATPase subunit
MTKDHPFWKVCGPITLLAAYALASLLPLSSFPFDLYLAGGIGLYLCSRFRLKGCSYALMLLALSGICGHLFLETHHFLRLGLEASLACSFFVAALFFENQEEGSSGLESQLASRAAAIQNLEEEISKTRVSLVEMQLASSQKIDELQKNYEEITAEKSSLEILNDVLRKANAAYFEEKKTFDSQALDNERRLASSQRDLEKLQEELTHFKEIDLAAAKTQRDLKTLQEELTRFKEIDLPSATRSLKEIEDLKMDRAEIQGRLAAAERKVQDLAKVEAQYLQLKTQFEEKGRVLHETRCQLFKAETNLQTLAIEKAEQNSLPEHLRIEFARVEQEIAALEGENRQLQDLVTHLTDRLQPASFAVHRTPLPAGQRSLEETLREALIPKRKKKAKKPAQQDLLF